MLTVLGVTMFLSSCQEAFGQRAACIEDSLSPSLHDRKDAVADGPFRQPLDDALAGNLDSCCSISFVLESHVIWNLSVAR